MHQLKKVQLLPTTLDEAWAFFSLPKNLALITPPALNLVPISELPPTMYPGIFIQYKVRPILGIAADWVTEITHIRDKEYFVDEQRLGPYRIWHHQHHFREIPGGVEMIDVVDYRLPLGPIGKLLEKWLVRSKLREIFDYRQERLELIFGKMP